ncbi:unnamed protein product, partial [Nesidiocoris tenuis]
MVSFGFGRIDFKYVFFRWTHYPTCPTSSTTQISDVQDEGTSMNISTGLESSHSPQSD